MKDEYKVLSIIVFGVLFNVVIYSLAIWKIMELI
jgi:hypothetical protein